MTIEAGVNPTAHSPVTYYQNRSCKNEIWYLLQLIVSKQSYVPMLSLHVCIERKSVGIITPFRTE
eukprot:scaffold45117_cov32-Cyclotella_meneghiniana.AAC.1